MKILPAKIDLFINDVASSNSISCLLYGLEYGMKSLYCDQIIKNLFSNEHEVYNYEGVNIDKDPSYLYSEVSNRDLIATPKGLVIKNPTLKTYQIIENIVKSGNLSKDEVYLIVIADELNVKSPLRKLYETEDNLAAMACYRDTEATTRNFIINYLKQNSIKYEDQVPELISSIISTDRLILLNELEKMNLYLGSEKFLTHVITKKILQEFRSVSMDNLIDNFFAGKKREAYKELQKVQEEGVSIITVARNMLTHLHKLRVMKYEIDFNGSSAIEQIKLYHIFYNRIGYFESHLKKWKLLGLKKVEKILYRLELYSKIYSENIAYASLHHVIMRLEI